MNIILGILILIVTIPIFPKLVETLSEAFDKD